MHFYATVQVALFSTPMAPQVNTWACKSRPQNGFVLPRIVGRKGSRILNVFYGQFEFEFDHVGRNADTSSAPSPPNIHTA